MKRLTDTQLEALMDLRDGEWTYGIRVRGRRSLSSLRKLGLVNQTYGDGAADEWQITPAGQEALQHQATLRHYRSAPRSKEACA